MTELEGIRLCARSSAQKALMNAVDDELDYIMEELSDQSYQLGLRDGEKRQNEAHA